MRGFPVRSQSALLAAAVASSALLGWSLSAAVRLAPLFAAALVAALWGLYDGRRRASRFAMQLVDAALRVDSADFRRPVSDRVSKELDRLAAALAGKNLDLVALDREKEFSELSLAAAFRAVNEPLLLVDRRGCVRMINAAVSKAFLVDEAGVKGSPFLQIVREHQVDDALQSCLNDGALREFELDVTTSTPPGRYAVRIQPIINSGAAARNGPPLVEGAIVAMTDVTRLRHLERVRKEFVANVSHELRTPITSIKGFVETLAGEDLPPEMRARFLTILQQEANRLDQLLTDLLDLSLLESDTRPIKREEVDLRELAERVVALLEPQARRKGIQTAVDVPPDLVRVPAHPGMLEQALVNLVDNAIKYSPEGSSVTIEGKRVGYEHVELAVVDNGPGIPSEHLPRLFERFYRVDKARSRPDGGTGLGLAIVRHIVQRHGGSVRAESRLGKGSRFVITLPVEVDEAPSPSWDR